MAILTQLPNSWPDIASFGPDFQRTLRRNTAAFEFDLFTEDNSGLTYAGFSDLESIGITSKSTVRNLHCSNKMLIGTVVTDYTIEDSFTLFKMMRQSSTNCLVESTEVETTELISLGHSKKLPNQVRSVSGTATSVLQVHTLTTSGQVESIVPVSVHMTFSRKNTGGATNFEISSTIDINKLSHDLARVFPAPNNVLTANFGTMRITGTTHFELDISEVD